MFQGSASLSEWKCNCGAAKVAALYCIGRATRGRSECEDCEAWARHDEQQQEVQFHPTYAALLVAIREVLDEMPRRRLVRTLSALADTHEDFPSSASSMPVAHRQRVLTLVNEICDRLSRQWEEDPSSLHDDRDAAHSLLALARLGLYRVDIFNIACKALANMLGRSTDDCRLPAEGLRQWLLAAHSVNHDLGMYGGVISEYPDRLWLEAETSRLHQLAGLLVFQKHPDPLLSNLISVINDRPDEQIGERSRATALYGLQAVRLLSDALVADEHRLQTTGQLRKSLQARLDLWLERKCRLARRGSALEDAVGELLHSLGMEPTPGVVLGHGISADFRCIHRGRVFYVEVDGPSHYCVQPPWRLRGRTLLKQRIFAACKWPLVPVPYWMAEPLLKKDGARQSWSRSREFDLCREELHAYILAQLTDMSSSSEESSPQLRSIRRPPDIALTTKRQRVNLCAGFPSRTHIALRLIDFLLCWPHAMYMDILVVWLRAQWISVWATEPKYQKNSIIIQWHTFLLC